MKQKLLSSALATAMAVAMAFSGVGGITVRAAEYAMEIATEDVMAVEETTSIGETIE